MHTIVAPEALRSVQQDVIRLAANNSGKFEISNRSDTRGPAVRAGKDKLYRPQDPSYAQDCCSAVSELIEMQLVRTGDGQKQFELTNFGWQLSRKLTLKSN